MCPFRVPMSLIYEKGRNNCCYSSCEAESPSVGARTLQDTSGLLPKAGEEPSAQSGGGDGGAQSERRCVAN